MASRTANRPPAPSTPESPAAKRKAIADGLSHLLADTCTLYLKTHNYHWKRHRSDVQRPTSDVRGGA